MESLKFFNDSEFAVIKKRHTKHGKKLFQRSPKYYEYILRINKEKEHRQRQRDLKKQTTTNSTVVSDKNEGKISSLFVNNVSLNKRWFITHH